MQCVRLCLRPCLRLCLWLLCLRCCLGWRLRLFVAARPGLGRAAAALAAALAAAALALCAAAGERGACLGDRLPVWWGSEDRLGMSGWVRMGEREGVMQEGRGGKVCRIVLELELRLRLG